MVDLSEALRMRLAPPCDQLRFETAVGSREFSIHEAVPVLAEAGHWLSVVGLASISSFDVRPDHVATVQFAHSGHLLTLGVSEMPNPLATITIEAGTSAEPVSRDRMPSRYPVEMKTGTIRRLAGLLHGASPRSEALRVEPGHALRQLAAALVECDTGQDVLRQLHADAVAVVLAVQLLSGQSPLLPKRRQAKTLPAWRTHRVFKYVDEHLSESITLDDLAGAAGLTSMYFASQFRAATNMRPHEYVLRRRIQRAQELLVLSPIRLIDVALEVGFQTQAHFTTVFKRFTGVTPLRWRQTVAKAADVSVC
jgi:AraC family transcriptional regulator